MKSSIVSLALVFLCFAEAICANPCERSLSATESNQDFLDDFFKRFNSNSNQPTPSTNPQNSGSQPAQGVTSSQPGAPLHSTQSSSTIQPKILQPALRIPSIYIQWYSHMLVTHDDNFLIYSELSTDSVSILDLRTLNKIAEIHHKHQIQRVLLSKDGKDVFTIGSDNIVKVTDTKSWKLIHSIPVSYSDDGYITPDGKHLVTVSNFTPFGEVIEIGSWRLIRSGFPVSSNANGIGVIDAFSPSGDYMITQHLGNTRIGNYRTFEPQIVEVVSGSSLSRTSLMNLGNEPARAISVSPNGEFIAIGMGDIFGSEFVVYKWGSWTELKRGATKTIQEIIFTSDSRFMIVVSQTEVDIFRTSDWQKVGDSHHNHILTKWKLDENAHIFVSADTGGEARVLDISTWQLHKVIHHASPKFGIQDFSISPSGHVIATAGADKSVLLTELTTGQPLGRIQHPGFSVTNVIVTKHYVISKSNGSEILITPY